MLIYFLLFMGGACGGSFFYTLALKYTSGMIDKEPFNALFMRSKCPSCKSEIGIFYLIPLLSYLFIRGRCTNCRTKISLFYPAWECIYGIVAVVVFFVLGLNLYALSVYLIIAICICISIVDAEIMIIPDSLLLAVFLISFYPVYINGNLIDNLIGLTIIGMFFLIIIFIFPASFGGGDLKMFSLAGFIFGLELSVVFVELTLMGSAIVAVSWAVISGRGLRIRIPFAPFITAGMIATFLFGNNLLLWYFSLIYDLA